MKRRLVMPALGLLALADPSRTAAATDTNNLTVTATVPGSCTIAGADLDFGNYDPAAALDAMGSISVSCTQGTRYWIGLGPGNDADATSRRMSSAAGDLLRYDLYRAAPPATPWDDVDPGQANHSTANVVGTNAYATDLHGRIPAGESVPAGVYTDTVVMTVNFFP